MQLWGKVSTFWDIGKASIQSDKYFPESPLVVPNYIITQDILIKPVKLEIGAYSSNYIIIVGSYPNRLATDQHDLKLYLLW